MVGLAVVLTSTVSQYMLDDLPELMVNPMTLTRPALQDPVLRTEREIFRCSCEQEEGKRGSLQVGYKPHIKIIPTANKLLGPPLQARGPCTGEGVTFLCHAGSTIQPLSSSSHLHMLFQKSL